MLLIEVNPRHVPCLPPGAGLRADRPRADEPESERARGTALRVVQAIAAGLKRYGGKHREFPNERSLFPYGFSPQEEAGILQRLKVLDAERIGLSQAQFASMIRVSVKTLQNWEQKRRSPTKTPDTSG